MTITINGIDAVRELLKQIPETELKNVKVAILIKQEAKIIKLSFRSKGDYSVERICRENFEGGGHRNASGGKSFLSIEETIEKIECIFEKENLLS